MSRNPSKPGYATAHFITPTNSRKNYMTISLGDEKTINRIKKLWLIRSLYELGIKLSKCYKLQTPKIVAKPISPFA